MSNSKMYVRVGRKFKYVPNMVGMYWNGLHLFSKEKRYDSFAMVIAQHYDHITMCALVSSRKTMNWEDAKEACKSYFGINGRLPSRTELLLLKNHSSLLESIYEHAPSVHFWTNEEYNSDRAWGLGLYLDSGFGYCTRNNKNSNGSVLAFVDVPIVDVVNCLIK